MAESAAGAAGKGFLYGVFGCLGAVVVLVVLLVSLTFCAASNVISSENRISDGNEHDGRAFLAHCGTGLSKKSAAEDRWAGARLGLVDPVVVRAAAPQVVTCVANLRDGSTATYQITANCGNGLESHCVALGGS